MANLNTLYGKVIAVYEKIRSKIADKTDKCVPESPGNFAALDKDGRLIDSRTKSSDFASAADTYTKQETDEAINALAAYYITSNPAGDAFASYDALVNAPVYYSGGKVRVPTRNDYAIVKADETHGGARWRYIYGEEGGESSDSADSSESGEQETPWEPQYPITTGDYEALDNKPSINGIEMSGDVNLTGADIAVSGTDATKISAALAGKLNKTCRVFYATCNSLPSDTAKVATVAEGDFLLATGSFVVVKFEYANASTVANPTLDVGGTGPNLIFRDGTNRSLESAWTAGESVPLVYDGANWLLLKPAYATVNQRGTVRLSDVIDTSSSRAVTPNAVRTAIGAKATGVAIRYATCDTASNEAGKTAIIADGKGEFSLDAGAVVVVAFANGLAASNPTLSIGGTAAKPIYRRDGLSPSSYAWSGGTSVAFLYNGNAWIMLRSANAAAGEFGTVKISDSSTASELTSSQTAVSQIALKNALADKASSADATLTPVYSDTPTFTEWDIEPATVTVGGQTFTLVAYDKVLGGVHYWCVAATAGSSSPMGHQPYDPTATNLTFAMPGGFSPSSVTATRTRTDILGYRLGPAADTNPNRDKLIASEAEAEALRTGKANRSDLDPLLFAQYYPDGSVKSTAEFTPGIKYDDPDTENRTITVRPFCDTNNSDNDNSSLFGRVVIPPFVDAQGNPYITDDGTRYRVVGISGGSPMAVSGSLTDIIAPNTVTSIGERAFAYCGRLNSFSLPAATDIGDETFGYCDRLITISLPAATNIGAAAFVQCNSLASVDFGDTPRSSVPTLGVDAFEDVPTSCKIIVPYTQYDAWIAADGWKDLPQDFVRHAENADRPATFTDGNLAALDANGNLTDSAIPAVNVATKAEVTEADDKATQALADAAEARAAAAEADDKATQALETIPYSLVTKTIDNGAVTLDDRADNYIDARSLGSSDTIDLDFPAIVDGKSRDFVLTVECGANPPAISYAAFVTIMAEDASMLTPESGMNIYAFTEFKPNMFLASRKLITTVVDNSPENGDQLLLAMQKRGIDTTNITDFGGVADALGIGDSATLQDAVDAVMN